MSLETAQAVARDGLIFGIKAAFVYVLFTVAFYVFDIHGKFGILRKSQPRVHFVTSLKTTWIPFLWGIGLIVSTTLLGVDPGELRMEDSPLISLTLPEPWVVVHSPNIYTDVALAVVGFYLVDLGDWTAHRVNHYFDVLYKKFPVGHWVHHNQVFVNPLAVFHSPLVHLAQLSGLFVYLLLLSQGLVVSVFLIHVVKTISNFSSHLGCDPLPWLTRLNHRVGGWIPWIPVHHQYHHLPFASEGNYGNVTCLWDYVFGTVVPESVHHIEHGEPTPEIAARLDDIEAEMSTFLADKTGLSIS
jgi:sterol desaturase/sphingolipid hydroxylase (fatty acid hydroxylase superfamily)